MSMIKPIESIHLFIDINIDKHTLTLVNLVVNGALLVHRTRLFVYLFLFAIVCLFVCLFTQ